MAATKRVVAGQTVRDLCLQETGGLANLFEFARRCLSLGLIGMATLDAMPSGGYDPDAFADLMENAEHVNRWAREERRVGQASLRPVDDPAPAPGGIGYWAIEEDFEIQ